MRPQDVFFLHVETPNVQQHVCGLALIDPTLPDGRRLRPDDVRDAVASRLDALPRFRQRLAVPALALSRPAWVDAEHFDVGFHVRAVTAAPPGGAGELAAVVGELISRHIDRTRPLWEIYLIEGLEDGRVAFFLKLHHAIADGLGGISVARTLFDATPIIPPPPSGQWWPRPAPRPLHLFAGALKEQVVAPFRLVADALEDLLEAPAPTLRRAGKISAGLWNLARAGTAPASPLNRPISPARRYGSVAVDLAAVKRVRLAFGASLTDVVLATLAGSLRRFFEDRGDRLPTRPLRAMVPISVRAQGRRGVAGNWTTAYSFDISLEDVPVQDRLAGIVVATRARRRSEEPQTARFVMNVAGTWLPAPVHAVAARKMYRQKWFNLIVSTMPGPFRPTYLAGARVDVAYPVLPLAEGVGLTVGAMTWEGRLTFGLTADAGIVSDLDHLAEAVRQSFDELVDAADARRPKAVEEEPERPPPARAGVSR